MSTNSERYELNKNLAQMLKGGVIMDVTTPEQAKIAEAAGACAVMALERIPADIRAAGGVSRMSDPKMIKGIQEAVSIPVMAKCRIGHFAEAQVLQAIEIDYIDESEVLSPADDVYHINKREFDVPFVCGAKDLGEALRRINEGASMIRTKGEPGTGDIVQAVRHMRKMNSEISKLVSMREDELFEAAKQLQVPYDLVLYVHENGKLPVVNFAAGGVATPADAALMMQLGAETYFETIPMTVKRNAYGRQLGSFHTNADASGIGEIPMTFIRAPFVESVHADASGNTPEILSIVENRIVGVKYKNQIAFAFHPELDQDTRIHEAFLGMIR